MSREQAEILYGAMAGMLVGIGYWIGRAWWAGNVAAAFGQEIVGAAVVGAIAGALAFLIRVNTR